MAAELHNSVNLFGTIAKELHSSLDLFGTLHKANKLQKHGDSSSSLVILSGVLHSFLTFR